MGNRSELITQYERHFAPNAIRQRRFEREKNFFRLLWSYMGGAAKRSLDLGLASVLLLSLAPVLLALFLANWLRQGAVVSSGRVGRYGSAFTLRSFSTGPWKGLLVLFSIWKGDMSFIGPRPLALDQASAADRFAWSRIPFRPGLVCPWWIRARTNIAYGTEAGATSEYVHTQSFWGDIGIALRALPACFYGAESRDVPEHIDVLGIPINNHTMEQAVDTILQKAIGTAPSQVCFVNADCVNIACRDSEYKQILKSCGYVLADGIGLKLAGKILGRAIRQNVNGTDLLPELCRELTRHKLGIYLLGGKPGVAADVAGWMSAAYPELKIRGHRHGYFSAQELPEVLSEIKTSHAEVLLVAFGVPKQEKWLRDHLRQTGAGVGIGVGGLFDFYSGRIPRAPVWVREVGMEWFFRFWQEPRRMWRRYFVGNAVFLIRMIYNRFQKQG